MQDFNSQKKWQVKIKNQDFPGGAVEKNSPANAGDTDSIPGLRTFYMLQSN